MPNNKLSEIVCPICRTQVTLIEIDLSLKYFEIGLTSAPNIRTLLNENKSGIVGPPTSFRPNWLVHPIIQGFICRQ